MENPEAGREALPPLRSGADLCIQLAYAIALKQSPASAIQRQPQPLSSLDQDTDFLEKGPDDEPVPSLAERARLAWDNSPLLRRPRLLLILARALTARSPDRQSLDETLAAFSEKAGSQKPTVLNLARHAPGSVAKPHFFKKVWDTVAPWIIPAIFVGLLPVGIIQLGAEKTFAAAGAWMAANALLGIAAMLGIRAHPFTLLAAVTLGPLSALHPFVGSGFVCAWAEYRNRRPRWNDLKSLAQDLRRIRSWFSNRALRVMLAWVAGSIANLLSNAAGIWLVVRVLNQ